MSALAGDAARARGHLRVGEQHVIALSDGEFVMDRSFLSDPNAHEALAGRDGVARLPVGAFLFPGDQPLLVDAGIGPAVIDGVLFGGNLLDQLSDHGVRPDDIATVALSHLHADHVGWLADRNGRPVFANARVMVGRGDWEHFVQGGRLAAHTAHGLAELERHGRIEVIDGDHRLTPHVLAQPAPGHTPGHTVFVVHDGDERAVLLGDAVYCPQQLAEPDWESISDVDPVLARRTRRALVADLERTGAAGLGCHFPGLRAARLVGGTWE